jgi:hypothetical protein
VQLQLRAHYWYKEALPGLAGLSKTKADKRLAELDKVAATAPIQGARMYAEIRRHIADKNFKKWELVGGTAARETFQEIIHDGALLVGFRYSQGADSRPGAVQALWQTSRGAVQGKLHGELEPGGKMQETKAKPGYAVGAIYVRGGPRFAGFKPIYMRITDQGLDTNDSYDGPYVGIPRGGEGTLGGDGNFIVGLHGKLGDRRIGTVSPVTLTVVKGKE